LMIADWNPRGAWVTATAYAVKDVVVESGSSYMCAVAHTSGTFATDLTAVKWITLSKSTTEVDETDTNTDKNKVVSNFLAKGWEDHLGNTSDPHGVTATQIGLAAADKTNADATFNKLINNLLTKTFNDYVAVGHLPLAGGTLTGRLTRKKGANIASAGTCDISGATGDLIHITGTTGITTFTMANGQMQEMIFDGAVPLTHNATTNKLIGGANITTAAGDRAKYFYDGTTVRMLVFSGADGKSVVASTNMKLVSTTYDLSTATGTKAITGAGFTPDAVAISFAVQGGEPSTSRGFHDGTNDHNSYWDENSDVVMDLTASFRYKSAAGNVNGDVQSLDADGCTLSFTKTTSPVGTINISLLFIK